MLATVDRLDDGRWVFFPEEDLTYYIVNRDCRSADVYLRDGRCLSDEQRRKIFAIIRDIALWNGDDPESIRGQMTWNFCEKYDCDAFSLSTRKPNAADMTTATEFISFLLDFCLYHGVPMKESLTDRADDLNRAMYLCLKHRKCAVCGRPADIHHIDSIGMGRDRERVIHAGLKAIALCRVHHTEAHQLGRDGLCEKYHVHGVRLDGYLCEKLGLNGG